MTTSSTTTALGGGGAVTTTGAITGVNSGFNGGATHAAVTINVANAGASAGNGCQLSISFASGVATVASVVSGGTGYTTGDTLTLTSAECVAAGLASGGGPATIAITACSSISFQAMINEIYTQLVTTCGLSQTSDTGQMANPSLATYPTVLGVTGATGYYVFKFNDTLQSTAPIFLRIDFGDVNVIQAPTCWITVGTGSNGAGTITGVVMTQVCVGANGASGPGPGTFVSNYVYNSTYGFLGMGAKQNAGSCGANGCYMGFALFRSSNQGTGAATADSIILITNNWSTAPTAAGGAMQWISGGFALPTLTAANTGAFVPSVYNGVPFNLTATLYNGIVTILPAWYLNLAQGLCQCPFIGFGLVSELALNSTFTATIAAGLSLTVKSVGVPWGAQGFMSVASVLSAGQATCLWLWQ